VHRRRAHLAIGLDGGHTIAARKQIACEQTGSCTDVSDMRLRIQITASSEFVKQRSRIVRARCDVVGDFRGKHVCRAARRGVVAMEIALCCAQDSVVVLIAWRRSLETHPIRSFKRASNASYLSSQNQASRQLK
jgi:hypothetical protein